MVSKTMTDKNTPEKDPIQDLLENKQVNFEDVEKEDPKENVNVEKEDEEIQEDLNKVEEDAKAQNEVKEELSIFSLVTRTELLIDKYKELKKESRKLSNDREDKGYEKEYKAQVQRRIDRLGKIRDFLKRYEDKPSHLSQKSLGRYDREIKGIESDVEKFEERRDDIVLEKAQGLPPYIIDIHTFKDAKKLRAAYEKTNDMLRKLNSLELDVDLQKELKDELEGLKKYLDDSGNGIIDPGKQAFRLKHWEDFVQLGLIDPELSQYVMPENADINNPNIPSSQPNYTIDKNGNRCVRKVQDYNNLDEAWKKGGVMGVIDYGFQNTKMNGKQRQFRHGAGNLALIAGGIWVGRKAISSILGIDKDKGKNRRKWIGGIVGGTLLLQGATGKGPIQALKEFFNGGEVPQRISDLFAGGKQGKNGGSNTGSEIGPDTPQEVIAYKNGFIGVGGIFGGMDIEEMKTRLVQEGGNTKIKDYNNFADYLRNIKKNEAGAKMVENLGQNSDKFNVVGLTLDGMGLNRDEIQKGGTEKFDKYYLNTAKNLQALDEYMTDKSYGGIKIDEFKNDIKSFIATGSPSLVALDKAGAFTKESQTKTPDKKVEDKDWRIKEFDLTKDDKLNLKNKIDTFTSVNPQEKNILIAAANILSKDTGNAIIEVKEVGSTIYLKTYGEWTPIDITNKMMANFKNGSENIYFDGAMELINAANLTNYIKHLFRGKHSGNVPVNGEYFARSTLLYNITSFTPLNGLGDLVYTMRQGDKSKDWRDPRSYGWTMNTEVTDAGWFGDLNKISPTLNTYVGEYSDYLNKLDIRHTGTKNDNLPT